MVTAIYSAVSSAAKQKTTLPHTWFFAVSSCFSIKERSL